MTPVEFFTALYAYCTQTHASVTSYLRTIEHNKAVGGVDGSPHVHGVGADVVYDPSRLLPSIRDEIAARIGLRIVHESDHDHLQPLDWHNQS